MNARPSFFAELKRRHVYKVGAMYAVGGWLLVQVATQVFPFFDVPGSAVRLVVILVALGFPIALVLSWIYDLTPQGLVRTDEAGAARPGAVPGSFGRWLNRLVIGLLSLALVYFVAQRFLLSPPKPAADVATARMEKSIAVLPFTDLSPAHDQEYFSDGMAEEILNALAQVKALKVAGRTSSFSFKGRNEDIRTIGKTLGVGAVLEGSVRKQGDKVRITAQLIQTEDGFHLWSKSYDGDLNDVFELQEKIARAITDQLEVVLAGDQKTRLVQAGTNNAEAYRLYLQATAALNARDYPRMGEAIGWLEEALKLDPAFARAHARLALIHGVGQAQYGASDTEGERHAQAALALDPALAETQYALSILARKQRRLLDAREAADRALELAPDDASAHLYAAQLLIVTGYRQQGIAHLDRALAIDPLLPNALNWRGHQYSFAGDQDAAERSFQRAKNLGLSFADAGFSEVARARGDYATARALTLPFLFKNGAADCLAAPKVSLPILLEGSLGGAAPARAKALAVIDECLAAKPAVVPAWVPIHLLRLGLPERALAVIGQGTTKDDATLFIWFWGPLGQDARRLPAFAEFARKFGFAALWDRYGAPDGCRQRAPLDYVCT